LNVSNILNNEEIEYWSVLARCSSEEQDLDGYSIETQVSECLKKLKEIPNGILYKTYSDKGYSGSDSYKKRPHLLEMLADAKAKKFKGLIIWKADRMARLSKDREELVLMLQRFNIIIVCCSGENLMDNSPQGRFVRKTMANVDELEVGVLALRVKTTMNTMIESGEWKGGNLPYGYQWIREGRSKRSIGKMIPINQEYVEQIQLIYSLYVNNFMGFGTIREYLNNNGYPYYKNGEKRKFNKDHIKTILSCPLYCSYQYNNNVYTKFEVREEGVKHKPRDQWEMHKANFIDPIISKEVFDNVQVIMKKKSDKTMPITKTTWLLTGLLICDHCNSAFCGHPMRQTYTRKKDGSTVEYDTSFYKCCGTQQYGRSFCSVKQIAKKIAEETVVNETLKYLQTLEQILTDDIIKDVNKRTKNITTNNQKRLLIINKELDKINKEYKKTISDYHNKELSSKAYSLAIEDIESREIQLSNEKTQLEESNENKIDIEAELKNLLKYFNQWKKTILDIDYSDSLTVTTTKGILFSLIKQIRWDGSKLKIDFISTESIVDFICKDEGLPTGKPTQTHIKNTLIKSIFNHGKISTSLSQRGEWGSR